MFALLRLDDVYHDLFAVWNDFVTSHININTAYIINGWILAWLKTGNAFSQMQL